MRFWHHFRVLRARRRTTVGVVAFAVALAAVVMYVYPVYPATRYESVARVLVTPPGYEATQLSDEPRPWNFGVNQDEIFTTTMAEMLKSRSVIELAGASLPDGEERVLSASLEVEPVKAPKQGVELLTHVIEVRSQARSAEQARRNTTALLDAFVGFHSATALAQAQKERDLIADEMESARARSVKARAALKAYKAEHGFVDLARNAAEMTDRYVQLQLDLVSSEAGLRTMSGAKKAATKRAMADTMELIKGLPEQEAKVAQLTIDQQVADESYRLLNSKLLAADVTKSINTAAGQVGVMDPASLPEVPVGYYEPGGALAFVPPFDYRKALVLLAVLVLSAAFAVSWMLIAERLDDRVRSGRDAERLTGLPLLGEVTASGSDLADDALCRECYNAIAARVVNHLAGGGGRVIAVAGAKTREGRTTVVEQLGRALAAAGLNVVLVDADLRTAALSTRTGMADGGGLAEAVTTGADAAGMPRGTGQPGLSVVPAGSGGAPVSVLSSERFATVVADAANGADVVLVDTPPVAAFADAVFVAREADAIIFVMRAGEAPAHHVHEEALRQLRVVNDHMLGVVLMGVDPALSETAYHFERHRERHAGDEGSSG